MEYQLKLLKKNVLDVFHSSRVSSSSKGSKDSEKWHIEAVEVVNQLKEVFLQVKEGKMSAVNVFEWTLSTFDEQKVKNKAGDRKRQIIECALNGVEAIFPLAVKEEVNDNKDLCSELSLTIERFIRQERLNPQACVRVCHALLKQREMIDDHRESGQFHPWTFILARKYTKEVVTLLLVGSSVSDIAESSRLVLGKRCTLQSGSEEGPDTEEVDQKQMQVLIRSYFDEITKDSKEKEAYFLSKLLMDSPALVSFLSSDQVLASITTPKVTKSSSPISLAMAVTKGCRKSSSLWKKLYIPALKRTFKWQDDVLTPHSSSQSMKRRKITPGYLGKDESKILSISKEGLAALAFVALRNISTIKSVSEDSNQHVDSELLPAKSDDERTRISKALSISVLGDLATQRYIENLLSTIEVEKEKDVHMSHTLLSLLFAAQPASVRNAVRCIVDRFQDAKLAHDNLALGRSLEEAHKLILVLAGTSGSPEGEKSSDLHGLLKEHWVKFLRIACQGSSPNYIRRKILTHLRKYLPQYFHRPGAVLSVCKALQIIHENSEYLEELLADLVIGEKTFRTPSLSSISSARIASEFSIKALILPELSIKFHTKRPAEKRLKEFKYSTIDPSKNIRKSQKHRMWIRVASSCIREGGEGASEIAAITLWKSLQERCQSCGIRTRQSPYQDRRDDPGNLSPGVVHNLFCAYPEIVQILDAVLSESGGRPITLACAEGIYASMLQGAKIFWSLALPPVSIQTRSLTALRRLVETFADQSRIHGALSRSSILFSPKESLKFRCLNPTEVLALIECLLGHHYGQLGESKMSTDVIKRILVRRMPEAVDYWKKFFPRICMLRRESNSTVSITSSPSPRSGSNSFRLPSQPEPTPSSAVPTIQK